jgi:hypothetical protein
LIDALFPLGHHFPGEVRAFAPLALGIVRTDVGFFAQDRFMVLGTVLEKF